MSTTKQRRGVLAVTLAVLALFLTGCMRIHMNATINPNDTVSGGMVFAISDETAQQFGMDPQELWDQMSAEMDTSLPDGGTQSSYAQDGYTGTQMTFADVPIAQWTAGTTSEDLNISKQGDEYVIDGVMDFTDDSGDLDEVPGAENLVNSMDIQISFTFPHGITDTNGTVSGNTVTWNPSFGESVEIYARGPATGGGAAPAGPASPGTTPDGTGTTPDGTGTTPDGTGATPGVPAPHPGVPAPQPGTPEPAGEGGFPWLWVGIGVGALVLAGIVAAVLMNRKKSDDAAAPYGAPPAGSAPYGSAPYGSAPQGSAPYGSAPYASSAQQAPGHYPGQNQQWGHQPTQQMPQQGGQWGGPQQGGPQDQALGSVPYEPGQGQPGQGQPGQNPWSQQPGQNPGQNPWGTPPQSGSAT